MIRGSDVVEWIARQKGMTGADTGSPSSPIRP